VRSLIAVGAWLLAWAPAWAQDSVVAPGTRVRITTRALERLEGTVTAWRGDTLTLRPKKGLLTEVPMGEVSDLSVVHGRRPNPWGGAVKGMVLGGGTGLVILSAMCGEQDIDPGAGEGSPDTCSWSDVGFLLMGTGALTVAGGVVGLVVGTVVGVEAWRPVPLPGPRLTLRPLPRGGVGVGFSIRF
jgi:hypothetical protein